MLLSTRFEQLWRRLEAQGDAAAAFAKLHAAYAVPERAYHNLTHIEDCLQQFDAAGRLADRPDEVEAALWYHDAVYDPRARDNEEKSAQLVEQSLRNAKVNKEAVGRIAAMILATRHDHEPKPRDAAFVVDVDLSIFGREPDVFDEYDRRIRQEYAWVPDNTYREARAEILERFLKRSWIYHGEHFRSRFEQLARKNLVRAVNRLRGSTVLP